MSHCSVKILLPNFFSRHFLGQSYVCINISESSEWGKGGGRATVSSPSLQSPKTHNFTNVLKTKHTTLFDMPVVQQ